MKEQKQFAQYGSPVMNVRMHKEMWRRIDERCAELHANRSEFIRKAVETTLTKEPEKHTHAK